MKHSESPIGATYKNNLIKFKQALNDLNNPELNKETYKLFQSKWCYGAAGMGLARVAAFAVTGIERYKQMAESACIAASEAKKDITNFSVCHGHFSNAEFLISASKVFNVASYFNEVKKLADYGIAFTDNNNREWSSGLMGNAASYSFMNGNAGIGNFYLRMADSKLIPSGLSLEELFM